MIIGVFLRNGFREYHRGWTQNASPSPVHAPWWTTEVVIRNTNGYSHSEHVRGTLGAVGQTTQQGIVPFLELQDAPVVCERTACCVIPIPKPAPITWHRENQCFAFEAASLQIHAKQVHLDSQETLASIGACVPSVSVHDSHENPAG